VLFILILHNSWFGFYFVSDYSFRGNPFLFLDDASVIVVRILDNSISCDTLRAIQPKQHVSPNLY
jgi:hypothetical protein